MVKKFTGNFTQQESLPPEALKRAADVLSGGRIHRYGTSTDETSQAAELESAYALWQGSKYCLAVASGGQAIQMALRAVGAKTGSRVLTNAFTLAPVPGAIAAVGAEGVLVETDENLTIDLNHLDTQANSAQASVLLLSHMRGHIADMDAVMEICNRHSIAVVEDCAHTMGSTYRGVRSGNHGSVACFSSQTYKHINSGEGGLLTTDDPEIAARATMMSGSYMNFERHGAGPDTDVFEDIKYEWPNMSARMDNLRAALLIPQLEDLDRNVERWNARHEILREALSVVPGVALPRAAEGAIRVGSSFQFRVPGASAAVCEQIIAAALEFGVELKWFGAAVPKGFTSNHNSWRYMNAQKLPETDRILSTLFDMRVPLTFSEEDCAHIAKILALVLTDAEKAFAAE